MRPLPAGPDRTPPLIAALDKDFHDDVTQQLPAVTAKIVKRRAEAHPSPDVSIVIPALNESASLVELEERVRETLEPLTSYEIIFVDDGSADESWAVMRTLAEVDGRVRSIRLRRNFGKAMGLGRIGRARGAASSS